MNVVSKRAFSTSMFLEKATFSAFKMLSLKQSETTPEEGGKSTWPNGLHVQQLWWQELYLATSNMTHLLHKSSPKMLSCWLGTFDVFAHQTLTFGDQRKIPGCDGNMGVSDGGDSLKTLLKPPADSTHHGGLPQKTRCLPLKFSLYVCIHTNNTVFVWPQEKVWFTSRK